jgi:aryl-alcohol dehydrogenase-like predicted oxidoreductase
MVDVVTGTPSPAFHTLGRSGLRVSRLGLGTMTFGQPGWGCDERTAGDLLDTYLDSGGNVVDTADIYAGGETERILGRLIAERGVRDRLVLTSKFSLGVRPGDPNAGGNGRKALLRSLHGSLERLGTDHLDVYFLHAWDGITPAEEVARTLDDVVRAGLVRYVALSDVPAWYAARVQTLAQWRGYEPLCALQLEYSLAERGVELEFPSLCQELGMGLVTWGPLANGLLSGAYSAVAADPDGAELPEGRLKATAAQRNPATDKRNPRTWRVVRALDTAAAELGVSAAQVAVAWVLQQPAVGTVLLGARRVPQLADTLAAQHLVLPPEVVARLDEASMPPRTVPYGFLASLQSRINAGVTAKPAGYERR